MILHLLRAVFVFVMSGIGFVYIEKVSQSLVLAVSASVLIVVIDVLTSRRKLIMAFSGVLLGLLIGLIVSFALGYVVTWLVDLGTKDLELKSNLTQYIKLMLNVVCCYLSISFVMQTKDDVRFIIPYVEFTKQSKGARAMLLDTSVLVDGRVADLAELGMFDSRMVITRFVLNELQILADCSDRLKRNRGRRGLEVVAKLQANRKLEVMIYEGLPRDSESVTVDHRLVALAMEMDARILTTDFNLDKVAQLRGVSVLNLSELAKTMKPPVLPGERIGVQVIRPGEQSGQGVGYLPDGTMVVVEQGKGFVGEDEVEVTVTSVVQTTAGRMVFAQVNNGEPRRPQRRGVTSAADPQAPAS